MTEIRTTLSYVVAIKLKGCQISLMDEEKQKNGRVNFYITPIQVQRMKELMESHGFPNINQTAKYLFMRGLTIETNLAGVIRTNDSLKEMVEIMDNEVAGLSSTATESHFRDNTIEMSFDSKPT